jgi:methionyl-tRNA formyltransferase
MKFPMKDTVTCTRVLLFGYGLRPVEIADFLVRVGARVVGLVVPSNRDGENIEVLVDHCQRKNIALLRQPASKNALPGFVQHCRLLSPDLILVPAYTMKLPQQVLDLPRLGAVNLHGGLLPKYRGAHVLQWAIIMGENETGVTAHYMDADWDTGPVIGEKRVSIEFTDHAINVWEKLNRAAIEVLTYHWAEIASGNAQGQPQDETKAKWWPARTADNGRINWRNPAERAYNLVRALVPPWPGAFSFFHGKKVVVTKAWPLPHRTAERLAGMIIGTEAAGVLVGTSPGMLRIEQVHLDGRSVTGPDILIALNAVIGDRFDQDL